MKIGNVTVKGSKYADGHYSVVVGRYPYDRVIYVTLVGPSAPYPGDRVTFSTNLRSYGAEVAQDEFNVKNWSENEGIEASMMATGLFEDTGRVTTSGFVTSPIWRIIDPKNVPGD